MGGAKPAHTRSLKARAIQWLAQREHSRLELRRKLLPHAEAEGAADSVDELLDWLQAHQYLSEQRFVESRIHVRAARFGNLRIRQELARHAVELAPEAAKALQQTEPERARDVLRRKFPHPPVNAAEQARQSRFLMGRGFSGEAIRQVMRDVSRGDSGAHTALPRGFADPDSDSDTDPGTDPD